MQIEKEQMKKNDEYQCGEKELGKNESCCCKISYGCGFFLSVTYFF